MKSILSVTGAQTMLPLFEIFKLLITIESKDTVVNESGFEFNCFNANTLVFSGLEISIGIILVPDGTNNSDEVEPVLSVELTVSRINSLMFELNSMQMIFALEAGWLLEPQREAFGIL